LNSDFNTNVTQKEVGINHARVYYQPTRDDCPFLEITKLKW